MAEGERSRLWNKILKKYIDFMNNSKTRLIGMSPAHAMTLEEVESKPSKKPKRAIGKDEEIKLQKGTAVRYLLKAGELEGDHRRRATDPYWSLRVYRIKESLSEEIYCNQSYIILWVNPLNQLPI